ncbi:ZAR1-like protein [Python bivittatus]|uniref:ZAR1-like protein n=1 Tax=Python bivittatus TaxID=176946 RepID=A0A9F2KUC6_PYTBI|nr:ZAR1-like protein [Python bivittatus]
MERFVYPPYSVYQSYGSTFTPSHNVATRLPSKQKQPSWKQSKSSGISNPYRGVLPAPSSAPSVSSPDYLDTYKRAQLKALLSHVSPGLTPRLRKANTKEVGVQVNPRVDAAVRGEAGEGGGCAAEEGKRTTFQFLEQKYGYFHCNDCKTRWESAYVWCISGTNKVYFKQLCRKCQKSFNPYKVEAIQCHICSKTRCSCPQKKRHIDLKRPHRQELCGRCKGKRLSCDNTYSFKYIV